MGVKVEITAGKTLDHVRKTGKYLIRGHDAQGIGQHEVTDPRVLQPRHQLIHIIGIVPITVGPVLQIEIDCQAFLVGVIDRFPDIPDMLGQALVELVAAVFLTALGQQVNDPPARIHHPVHAALEIDETEHLDSISQTDQIGPFHDVRHRLFFAFRHPGRSHLDPIDLKLLQQRLGDIEFLGR